MKTYAILLPVNELPRVIEFKAEQEGLDYYYNEIDCELIDIVHTTIEDTCLVVDDEGLCKEEPLVNIVASILYGVAQHGQPIVGNALLCREELTPDGLETKGFPKEIADGLVSALRHALIND